MPLTFEDCKQEMFFAQNVSSVIESVKQGIYSKERGFERVEELYKAYLKKGD